MYYVNSYPQAVSDLDSSGSVVFLNVVWMRTNKRISMNGYSPDVGASESPFVAFFDIFLIGCCESSSSSDNTRLAVSLAICK